MLRTIATYTLCIACLIILHSQVAAQQRCLKFDRKQIPVINALVQSVPEDFYETIKPLGRLVIRITLQPDGTVKKARATPRNTELERKAAQITFKPIPGLHFPLFPCKGKLVLNMANTDEHEQSVRRHQPPFSCSLICRGYPLRTSMSAWNRSARETTAWPYVLRKRA